MASIENACSEGTVLAVLALALHSPKVRMTESWFDVAGRRPKQGPLEYVRLINLYGGAIDTVTMHIEALSRLITFRGGLHALTMPGIAHISS